MTLFVVGTCAYAEEGNPTERAILEELRAIREAIEELNTTLGSIGSKLAAEEPSETHAFYERGADTKALLEIELPESPSKEQVREYARKIMIASKMQNSFSTNDPQSRMLAEVGPEHVDVLIEYVNGGALSSMYFVEAIVQLADERHQSAIFDALPFARNLVKVVIEKGWEEEAKDILLTELRSFSRHLPCEWIDAVVLLNDPKTYPDLLNYLINGGSKAQTYKSIRNLPGVELEEAVAKAWENAKREPWESASFAPVAIEFGHLDALELAVKHLNDDPRMSHWYDARGLLLRHTDAYGTNEDIQRWFFENKDKLVFDPESKKFHVGKP
jgi:hypothetical protein